MKNNRRSAWEYLTERGYCLTWPPELVDQFLESSSPLRERLASEDFSQAAARSGITQSELIRGTRAGHSPLVYLYLEKVCQRAARKLGFGSVEAIADMEEVRSAAFETLRRGAKSYRPDFKGRANRWTIYLSVFMVREVTRWLCGELDRRRTIVEEDAIHQEICPKAISYELKELFEMAAGAFRDLPFGEQSKALFLASAVSAAAFEKLRKTLKVPRRTAFLQLKILGEALLRQVRRDYEYVPRSISSIF